MRRSRFSAQFAALRHVPAKAILLRIRREFRQRRLVRSHSAVDRLGVSLPNVSRVADNLIHPDFCAFATKTRELTSSAFSYDRENDALVFALSGDVAGLGDVDAVRWTEPGGIPASDVNRCFFMSFVEQASLLDGPPEDDLERLDVYVTRLVRAAPLDCGRLTIPWQALSVARRLVNLIAGLSSILDRDPSLAGRPDVARLIAHVALLRSIVGEIREDDLGYNHLASEIFAQCVVDRLCDERAALERHAGEFVAVMTAQVGADGLQLERSATYQAHMLGHLDVLIAGRILPEPHHTAIVGLAEAMRPALALMTHRDGGIAVFNDSAIGDGPSPTALGAAGGEWAEGVHRLPVGGYARLEHGALCALFDAGPCGADDNPGHAHADFLSFELDIGAERFIVDPGVATYKGGPERDACRSSANHNGPTFLGLEPIEFVGAFRIGDRGRGRFFDPAQEARLAAVCPGVGGVQDGFRRSGGNVSRWLGAPSASVILVVDCWSGCPGHAAQSAFLIDAAAWVLEGSSEAQAVFVNVRTGDRATLTAVAGRLVVEDGGDYYPYGPRQPLAARRVAVVPDETGSQDRIAMLAIAQGDGVIQGLASKGGLIAQMLTAREDAQ